MSTEVFEERISSLKSDLAACRKDILDHLAAIYSGQKSGSIVNLKSDATNMLKVLQHDVVEVLQLSKQRSDYNKTHADEIKECSSLISILELVSQLSECLLGVQNEINRLDFLKACGMLGEADVMIHKLPMPNTEVGAGKICTLLRKEYRVLRSTLVSKLSRMLNEAIKFEKGHIVVFKELKGVLRCEDVVLDEPVLLCNLWQSVLILDKTDELVTDILRNFWKHILRPLWSEKKYHAPVVSSKQSHISELRYDNIARESLLTNNTNTTSNKSEFTSNKDEKISSSSNKSSTFVIDSHCRMPLPQLLESLSQSFSFIYAEVICANAEVSSCIARILQTPSFSIVNAIIDSIASHLPKNENELANYSKLLEKPVRDFERNCEIFGFFSSSATSTQEDELKENKVVSNNTKNNNTNAATGSNNTLKNKQEPLTEYLSNLHSIYADLRRRDILKQARDLVLADYHNTMMATGDALEDELSSAGDIGDPRALLDQSGSFAIQKLKFDSCQISLAVCRILKLIHDVMKQACHAASIRVANILLQSARDCIEIFMAIVPMKFADVIHTIPRMGCIFYNDCLYLAHNTILITHHYKQDLGKIDPVLQNNVGFVDFIPRLRQLGDQCISGHIDEQKKTLSDLVKRINISPDGETIVNNADTSSSNSNNSNSHNQNIFKGGLQLAGKIRNKIVQKVKTNASNLLNKSNSDNNSNNTIMIDDELILNDEEMITAIIKHFERLSGQLNGVLQELIYSRLFGYMLENVIKECMTPLLQADCIAESSGNEICKMFRSLQQIRIIFPNESKDDELMTKICPSWKKFLALTDLLEYSLSEISEWLPRKKFSSFTGQEMISLIKALFDDTPRRQSIITSILEMSS